MITRYVCMGRSPFWHIVRPPGHDAYCGVPLDDKYEPIATLPAGEIACPGCVQEQARLLDRLKAWGQHVYETVVCAQVS